MKKGHIIAAVGLLIILGVLGYFFGNKPAPSTQGHNTAGNPAKVIEKQAPTKNTTKPSSTPTASQQIGPNTTNTENKSVPKEDPDKTETASVTENSVPLTIAEQIDTAIKNKESCWLLFRSTTCIPCIEMQKLFDQLEPEFKGKIRFIAIDVNEKNNQDIIKTWKIRYIPTTFILDGKGQISYQNVGVIPVENLKAELNKVVE